MSIPWNCDRECAQTQLVEYIKNRWFMKELYAEKNTFEANRQLVAHYNQYMLPYYHCKLPPNTRITFERLRAHSAWKECAENILEKEVRQRILSYETLGYVHHEQPLMGVYLCELVKECWAKPILSRVARRWIERRYRPGGAGFLRAQSEWKRLVA